MAKKITKSIVKTTEPTPELKKEDVLLKARSQGYLGKDSLYELQEWIMNKHFLYGEIFYSMFHKKFSINNYFVDIAHGKKIDWDYKSVQYGTHSEAQVVMLYNMLLLTK